MHDIIRSFSRYDTTSSSRSRSHPFLTNNSIFLFLLVCGGIPQRTTAAYRCVWVPYDSFLLQGSKLWDNNYGYGIAVSDNFQYVVVGAPKTTNRWRKIQSAGAVRVYYRQRNTTNGQFISVRQIGKTIYGDVPKGRFGFTTALSATGTTLVVGMPGSDDYFNYGKAIVYKIDQVKNTITQIGTPFVGTSFSANIGGVIAISKYNDVIALGSPLLSQVCIYKFNGTDWSTNGIPCLMGTGNGDGFGSSIAFSSDGNQVVIGDATAGSVFVKMYEYNKTSNQYELLGKQLDNISSYSYNGIDVDFAKNGTIVAIGAPGNNEGLGSVQVYQYNTASKEWLSFGASILGSKEGNVTAPFYGSFGSEVSLSQDGMNLAIGAPLSYDNRGEVQVYKYNGTGWVKTWLFFRIAPPYKDGQCGTSLQISNDGNDVMVGIPFNKRGKVLQYSKLCDDNTTIERPCSVLYSYTTTRYRFFTKSTSGQCKNLFLTQKEFEDRQANGLQQTCGSCPV